MATELKPLAVCELPEAKYFLQIGINELSTKSTLSQ